MSETTAFKATIIDITHLGVCVKLEGKKTPVFIFNQELGVKDIKEQQTKLWTKYTHSANMPFAYYGKEIEVYAGYKTKQGYIAGEVTPECSYVFKDQVASMVTIKEKLEKYKSSRKNLTLPAVVTGINSQSGPTNRINASLLDYEGIEIAAFVGSNIDCYYPGDIVFIRVDSIFSEEQFKLRGTLIAESNKRIHAKFAALREIMTYPGYKDTIQLFIEHNILSMHDLANYSGYITTVIDEMLEAELIFKVKTSAGEYICLSNYLIRELDFNLFEDTILSESLLMMFINKIKSVEIYNRLIEFQDFLWESGLRTICLNHATMPDVLMLKGIEAEGGIVHLLFDLNTGDITTTDIGAYSVELITEFSEQ